MLRRRRCARDEDESDLSEGFESDEEEEEEHGGAPDGLPVCRTPANSLGKEGQSREGAWESGSEEEEEGGTAFDVETDSDMNSQESRSDLEDMEDTESPAQEQQQQEEDEEEQRTLQQPSPDERATPPATNGPLLSNDTSISSNLQAMSSQLFQAKRCFRLAPTFSNVLLSPANASNPAPDSDPTPSQGVTPPPGDMSGSATPEIANGTNDNGKVCCFFLFLFHYLSFCNLFLFPPQMLNLIRRTASKVTSHFTVRKLSPRDWRSSRIRASFRL